MQVVDIANWIYNVADNKYVSGTSLLAALSSPFWTALVQAVVSTISLTFALIVLYYKIKIEKVKLKKEELELENQRKGKDGKNKSSKKRRRS